MSDQNQTPIKEKHKMKKTTKIIISSIAVAVIATPIIMGVSHARERWAGHQGQNFGHGMMQGGHMQNMAKKIKEIDTNDDGIISLNEVQAWQTSKMTNYDTNADGQMDLGEFEALWIEQKRSHMVDKFQNFDEDGDGQITSDELAAPLNFMFERFDKDGNGEITKQEMKKSHKRGHRYHGNKGSDDINGDDDYEDDDDDDDDENSKGKS